MLSLGESSFKKFFLYSQQECRRLWNQQTVRFPPSAKCDSLKHSGQSSRPANYSQFPEACFQYWISGKPMIVWVLLLVVLEVCCLANTFLFPLSLTTFTTHSFGTDWYVTMASEPAFQNTGPASCAVDKWIQYTASCSSLQWMWYCTFWGCVISVMDSASSASLLKGSRGVKKIVCLPFLRSFPSATNRISAMEYWSRARPTWRKNRFQKEESSRNSSVLVRWSLHLNDPGLHEDILILHFHLYRFQTLSWCFQDKGKGAHPRPWTLSPVDFWIFLSILEVITSQCIAPSVSRSSWCRTIFVTH